MVYSIIVATFNRLDELKELAASLIKMTEAGLPDGVHLEWLIVDDGSTDGTAEYFEAQTFPFSVRLLTQSNQGPGSARNLGMKHARGDVFIFLDSDCTVPKGYLNAVHQGIVNHHLDSFGGPDTYRADFPPLLKAINYSMTSFLGTGGTRGSSKSVTKFYPRSFNMGLSREVYETVGEMGKMRHGQDMDYSARIYKTGFNVGLIADAFVYHKRRTSLKKFFKQIFNWGVARINLGSIHPELMKPIHLLPAILVFSACILLVGSLFFLTFRWVLSLSFICFALLLMFVFFHSTFTYKSIKVGAFSILTLPLQILAYGLGSITGLLQKLSGKESASGFVKNYYK